MNELLNGIKAGDFVEFDLVTSPVEVYRVDESKSRVRLFLGVVRVHGVCYINEMEHKMDVLKKLVFIQLLILST